MLYSVLVSVDVLIAASLIGLVLLQQGKGASVGAAFGSGASSTVFGSRGSASFLTRATAILAALFFVNSIVLAYLASNRPVAESVVESAAPAQEEKVDAELIEMIKDQLDEQLESSAQEQPPSLPEDVPSLSGEGETAGGTGEIIEEVKVQVQQETESSKEAVQSLPTDVPQ